jgi:hypothetical protein
MPAAVMMRRAFSVVLSSVWLPATVVTASRSIAGFAAASMIANASSCPGSQSRITGVAMKRIYHYHPTGNMGGRLTLGGFDAWDQPDTIFPAVSMPSAFARANPR